jgi:pilus assembly protein CpaB
MPRPRFFLILALAAIGIALAAHLLVGRGSRAVAAPGNAAAGPAAARAPKVLTVRGSLPPGHILRPDDLAEVRWPVGSPPAGALMAGSPEARALAGAVTRRSFAAGELLVKGSVISPGERGFLAAIVSPGHRAIALSVEAETSAGGLIWPGDRVDIILTQEIREDGVPLAQQVVSETILEDVRVLSTDQKLDSATDSAGTVEGKVEPRRVPTTVTVEVTPDEAERVTVGRTLGRLHLTLRGVEAEPTRPGPAEPVAGTAVPVPGPDARGVTRGVSGSVTHSVTWAGGVSPALGAVRQRSQPALSAAPAAAQPPAPPAEARADPNRQSGVRVYRGSAGA